MSHTKETEFSTKDGELLISRKHYDEQGNLIKEFTFQKKYLGYLVWGVVYAGICVGITYLSFLL